MSTVFAIGSIVALVFLVLGIAALPALRKATKEGQKLLSTWREIQAQNCAGILNHEVRLKKLEEFHAEECEYRPALLVARFAAISAAVQSGHLRTEEGRALNERVWDKLAEETHRRCAKLAEETKSEGVS